MEPYNTLSARLKLVRKSLKKSQKSMAAALGIGLGSWQHYERGQQVPGGKVFESLCCLGFNANWLLTGEGPMCREDTGQFPSGRDDKLCDVLHPEYGAARRSEDEFVRIPAYDFQIVPAPKIEGEKLVDWISFKREWIHRVLRSSVSNLYLLHIVGESMLPTLSDGDIVIVEEFRTGVQRDGIYVLRVDNALLIKRLQFLPGGKAKATSDNPAYGPFAIDLTDEETQNIEIIGRIIWIGHKT